ncbi:MAG: hypothetical protein M3Y22_18330 [Pseudomonadota bacterium]|nr:hypothetical protein [Pseudomonadota bacterium]
MPFLLVAYLVCYIDQVNVGFASLPMNKAIGIDPKTYGLGAGKPLSATSLWKCPATWGLEKFGASKWIARMVVSWGCFALISGPVAFLVLCFRPTVGVMRSIDPT